MAVISTLLTELRVDINDGSSTRFSDAQLLALFKKAIRRANRICQRNDIQFAKKEIALATVASQAYIDISSTVSDFDVWIGLFYDATYKEIPMKNEREWEALYSTSRALSYCYLDQVNSKIYLKGTPSSIVALTLWYYPTVDPSAYTVASSTPWGGRIDDILLEYVRVRALNMDEYDVTFDSQLMTDLENQILGAYKQNSVTRVDGNGWFS
jgi:hypothetical protein